MTLDIDLNWMLEPCLRYFSLSNCLRIAQGYTRWLSYSDGELEFALDTYPQVIWPGAFLTRINVWEQLEILLQRTDGLCLLKLADDSAESVWGVALSPEKGNVPLILPALTPLVAVGWRFGRLQIPPARVVESRNRSAPYNLAFLPYPPSNE